MSHYAVIMQMFLVVMWRRKRMEDRMVIKAFKDSFKTVFFYLDKAFYQSI